MLTKRKKKCQCWSGYFGGQINMRINQWPQHNHPWGYAPDLIEVIVKQAPPLELPEHDLVRRHRHPAQTIPTTLQLQINTTKFADESTDRADTRGNASDLQAIWVLEDRGDVGGPGAGGGGGKGEGRRHQHHRRRHLVVRRHQHHHRRHPRLRFASSPANRSLFQTMKLTKRPPLLINLFPFPFRLRFRARGWSLPGLYANRVLSLPFLPNKPGLQPWARPMWAHKYGPATMGQACLSPHKRAHMSGSSSSVRLVVFLLSSDLQFLSNPWCLAPRKSGWRIRRRLTSPTRCRIQVRSIVLLDFVATW